MKKFFLMILSLVLLIPFQVSAQDDFAQVKTPNVMIIFDTSNSMDQKPDGWSQGSGNVRVDSEGKIVSAPSGTVYNFEGGGNHPNSKLYQAKLALKEIIDTVVKDRVNLGFSNYAQLKTENRRGYYKRDKRNYKADEWRWDKLYWRFNNYKHTYTATSFLSNSFKDFTGYTHPPGVGKNYTFSYPHTFHNSKKNNNKNEPPPHPPGTYTANLKYTVTNIVYNAEYNWYTYSYESDAHEHYEEQNQSKIKTSNAPIDCNSEFPKDWGSGGWKTYHPGDSVYDTNPSKWECKGPTKLAGYDYWLVQWSWVQFNNSTDCPSTSGSDNLSDLNKNNQYTKWYLVDPNDPALSSTHSVKVTQKNCYDWSTYYYPADGSTDKPHAWSYFKISGNTWPVDNHKTNYYPSKDGSGNFNNVEGTYDNHFFFINFPDDKFNFKDSDRTVITNRIRSYLDLTPVQSPETGRFWTKLPLHESYGKKGLTSNTQASTFTPLADSLAWGFLYFDDYINRYKGGDPSSKEKFGETLCRGNYIILLTDGLESAKIKGGKPDYDAAPQEAANLLTINVKTFVIGFGQDIVGNQTLNNIAALGGTDKAYFAANFNELKAALASIFQAITGQYYGRSNPVVSRSRERLYRGNFDIRDGNWLGHLMAWDADKETGVLAPDFAWDSGEEITKAGRGVVYTWTDAGLNPARKEFKVSESSLYPLVNPPVTGYPSGVDIDGDLDVDNDDAKTVINFTLLPEYDSGKYKGNRALNVDIKGTTYPSWKLGDIYHSTPVVIGEPAFFFKDNDYTAFYLANKNREKMIYVGTNDGMLHGFKNSDGREVFSIIPKNLLGKLKDLRSTHDFYVDASPKAYDVYFKDESKWKTVLVTGQRGGGPYYFAVDVTTPNDPKILWELTHGNMGDSWAKPDIGKIKDGGDTKFAAFLTGGYSTTETENKGNSFYIVDIETGTILKNFTVGDSTNKIPSAVTAFDADEDGYIDYIYLGDKQGTLWKVDVRSSNKDDWTLYKFFKPSNPKLRPIFYPPAVVKNNKGKILVFFGTGDELGLDTLTDNYFYEVEDEVATGKENWNKPLEDGEKVLASPAVINNVVYFTTWVYMVSGDFCGAGEGRLWGLKVSKLGENGGDAGLVTLDTDTGKWKAPQEYISLGAGIPSAPVVTNGMIYVGTSLNANRVIQVPIPPQAVARIKSWREVVR